MTKYFTNTYSVINLYKKASSRSEIVTQMIYGDSFYVIKKTNKWIKIRIREDNYLGFIRKKKFTTYLKPTHKISVLSANIFTKPNLKNQMGKLTFSSKIKIERKIKNFSGFQNKWIETKNLKNINFKKKDLFKDVKVFKNVRYKWGGKTFEGIDCSALVQVFLNFQNKPCPRNANEQVKYFKKNISINNIQKNDLIYWKGHVAIAISKKKLIHAYGPLKKTVIMSINKTIKIIKNTAKLKIMCVKRVWSK